MGVGGGEYFPEKTKGPDWPEPKYGAREEFYSRDGELRNRGEAVTFRIYPEGVRVGCTFLDSTAIKHIIKEYISKRLIGETE